MNLINYYNENKKTIIYTSPITSNEINKNSRYYYGTNENGQFGWFQLPSKIEVENNYSILFEGEKNDR